MCNDALYASTHTHTHLTSNSFDRFSLLDVVSDGLTNSPKCVCCGKASGEKGGTYTNSTNARQRAHHAEGKKARIAMVEHGSEMGKMHTKTQTQTGRGAMWIWVVSKDLSEPAWYVKLADDDVRAFRAGLLY